MDSVSLMALLEKGGPWAVAALAIAGIIWERKKADRKDEKMMQFVVEQVKTMASLESAVVSMKEVLAEVLRRM